MEAMQEGEEYTLVARKPHFGLPTACPTCLPAYIYLKFGRFHFQLAFNSIYPDSDQLPYFEAGTYVAYNNENDGVIECIKKDGILDLDTDLQSLPEWISMKAVVTSWLDEALMYELWIGSDGTSARKIYYSDLSWPIGKILFLKQTYILKQRLGITKENAEQREEQIYQRAKVAYEALSTRLGEQNFLFEDRPSSLDASFLGHVLFTLQAFPETSVLRSKLLEHSNLVRYAERLKMDFLEAGPSSSSIPQAHSVPSPSASRKGASNWSSKPKTKPKKEKTEEEKTFKRRAKYFLAAQLLAVLLFLSVMGGNDFGEAEFDDDNDGIVYD